MPYSSQLWVYLWLTGQFWGLTLPYRSIVGSIHTLRVSFCFCGVYLWPIGQNVGYIYAQVIVRNICGLQVIFTPQVNFCSLSVLCRWISRSVDALQVNFWGLSMPNRLIFFLVYICTEEQFLGIWVCTTSQFLGIYLCPTGPLGLSMPYR